MKIFSPLFGILDPERRCRGFVILHSRPSSHRQLVGGFQIRIMCRPECPSEHPGQRVNYYELNYDKSLPFLAMLPNCMK
jgi:hypothetical protein